MDATIPASPHPPAPLPHLVPLQLDNVSLLHLSRPSKVIQVSLKPATTDEALFELYDKVKEDVTDLVAFTLRLESTSNRLPSPLRFEDNAKGYALTCERRPPSKTLMRWEVRREGTLTEPAECKYRFVLSRIGPGG